MSVFTPVTGLIGGSIIGLSAVTLLLGNGDIMGCSGIVTSSLLDPITTFNNIQYRWKYLYLGAFIMMVNIITSSSSSSSRIVVLSPSTSSTIAYILGGFCVGIGTKLANGCTSGHGVCGLGRFSIRSLASVISFLVTGIVTATCISSPYTPWASYTAFLRVTATNETTNTSTNAMLKTIVLSLSIGMAILSIAQNSNLIRSFSSSNNTVQQQEQSSPSSSTSRTLSDQVHQNKVYGAVVSGALFAMGLGISGMSQTNKVKAFLDMNPLFRNNSNVNISYYDPTLLTVLGSAVPVFALGYLYQQTYLKHTTTYCGADWSCIPNRTDIDSKLIGGSILFGIGWGLVGLCPGPAIWSFAAGVTPVAMYWFPSFLLGSYTGKRISDNTTSKTSTYSRIPNNN